MRSPAHISLPTAVRPSSHPKATRYALSQLATCYVDGRKTLNSDSGINTTPVAAKAADATPNSHGLRPPSCGDMACGEMGEEGAIASACVSGGRRADLKKTRQKAPPGMMAVSMFAVTAPHMLTIRLRSEVPRAMPQVVRRKARLTSNAVCPFRSALSEDSTLGD